MLLVLNGLENTLIVYTFHSAEVIKHSTPVLSKGEYCFISSTQIHCFEAGLQIPLSVKIWLGCKSINLNQTVAYMQCSTSTN